MRAGCRGPRLRYMVIAFLTLYVSAAAISLFLVRRRDVRWPFISSGLFAGLALVIVGGAALVAHTIGRDTWNSWVAGTPERENVTLTVILVGLPGLAILAVLSLVVGHVVNRDRQ